MAIALLDSPAISRTAPPRRFSQSSEAVTVAINPESTLLAFDLSDRFQ